VSPPKFPVSILRIDIRAWGKGDADAIAELLDTLARTTEMELIETVPGKANMKVLWASPETGRWAVLLRWKKGYVAAPHGHLSGARA